MGRKQIHPFLAGIAAALCGAGSGSLLLTVFGFSGPVESVSHIVGGAASVAFYGFLFGLPVVVLYGMPIYAVLRRFGAANQIAAVLFGGLPGVLWVQWTHGSWLDPVLWIGVLTAVYYVLLRQQHGPS
jgi:hypothetical protein